MPASSVAVRRRSRDLALTALVALAVTALVCGQSLGRGLYLYRDFVTVPRPVWSPSTWGEGQAPRAVPLDAVMTALSGVVPTGVQQQAMLTGAIFLAGLGTAVLLRRWGLAAMLTGAVLAMWNPYVTERLLIGQPPTLFAYSMTPWLLAVVLSRFAGAKALGVLAVLGLPAALTPWGGLVAAMVLVASSLFSPHRRQAGWLLGSVLVAVAWCLPWVVPALAQSAGGADPDGARAFALAADSPLGVLGSALTLGGIWAPGAQPVSRGSLTSMVASCLILAAAAVGFVALLRGRSRPALSLGLAWLAPPVAAWLLSTGPGLAVFAGLQGLPGVAIGRDTHRWLGLSALAVAVLAGAGVRQLGRRLQPRGTSTSTGPVAATAASTGGSASGRLVSGAAAVVMVSLGVLSTPDLPKAVHAAYRPITMPADWEATVGAAAESAGDGIVAVLPWQPFRSVPWAGEGSFLDPLPRALPGRVLTAHELTVVRDGQPITVDDDASGYAAWRAGQLDVADLRGRGVTAVVVWKGTPGGVSPMPTGLRLVHDSANFAVWAT